LRATRRLRADGGVRTVSAAEWLQGALAKLAAAPFGDALLALLALGLAAFVLWQVVLGLLDPEHRGERRTVNRRAPRDESQAHRGMILWGF
jgi:hypothetical protein